MISFKHIEDLFIEFVEVIERNRIPIQYQDRSAMFSFYNQLNSNNSVTEKQGAYILKLLFKYRNSTKDFIDYEHILEHPVWKTPFRVIDNSKKVWVEKHEVGLPVICLKFPFGFKDTFENEFPAYRSNIKSWDPERKIRILDLYEQNLVKILEFCQTNEFEIEPEVFDISDRIEEIWSEQDDYNFTCYIDKEVKLKNAPADANSYFSEKKTGNVLSDLLIAKTMGYIFTGPVTNVVENICASPKNSFWVKTVQEFMEIAKYVPGKVPIILDRTSDNVFFIKEVDNNIDRLGFNRDEWRVCFRTKNKEDSKFNSWIAEKGFGGKITNAKYLMFQHKPHKWLFNKENDVIMLATNNINPSTQSMTRSMFEHHPLVIYVSDVQPTIYRKENIVQL